MPKNLTELSEQIQDDIITCCNGFGQEEHKFVTALCQIVVDRVNELKKSNENSLGD